MELVIYADESDEKGPKYSNFYGGALVRAKHIDAVRQTLLKRKEELGFFGEVKWTKVTATYLDRYKELMDTFFEMVAVDHVKVRVMFSDNRFHPVGLTAEDRDESYTKLYYQFFKHAFGLRYVDANAGPYSLRLYLDALPCNKARAQRFKQHLSALEDLAAFRNVGIKIPHAAIAEVRSHDHVVLQCLDVVLGAMQFRLNEKHLIKPPGARVRGKKTRAKEQLYKHIHGHLRAMRPGFNIGISTGRDGEYANCRRAAESA